MNEPRRSILPVAIGIGLTALLLLLLAYITKQRNAEIAGMPQLSLVAPPPDAVVDSPLTIVFSSSRPLLLKPTGWSVGQLHLHAWVNGVQIMPAASDIQHRSDGTYQWTLPAARGQGQELYLSWADAMHKPVTEGGTTPISVTIR